MFKDVVYVPSLAVNLLSTYQMNHTCSPKRVVFDIDSMEISDISTRKLIAKGVANHASKEYEFSHFFPYLDTVQIMRPFKREGKLILPKPFSYDDVSCDVSESK